MLLTRFEASHFTSGLESPPLSLHEYVELNGGNVRSSFFSFDVFMSHIPGMLVTWLELMWLLEGPLVHTYTLKLLAVCTRNDCPNRKAFLLYAFDRTLLVPLEYRLYLLACCSLHRMAKENSSVWRRSCQTVCTLDPWLSFHPDLRPFSH